MKFLGLIWFEFFTAKRADIGVQGEQASVIYIVRRFAGVIGVTYARAAEYMTTGDGMRSLSYCLPGIRFQADIATA